MIKLLPLFEHMGDSRNTGGVIKEFWWEREWRHKGDFSLPEHFVGLCPENEIRDFQKLVKTQRLNFYPDAPKKIRFIDPRWGLEKIIACLAGFADEDIDVF